MDVNVLVVYPLEHMADWELQLPCPVSQKHHMHITRPGKDRNSSSVFTECILLSHHGKAKKKIVSWTIVSLGQSVFT